MDLIFGLFTLVSFVAGMIFLATIVYLIAKAINGQGSGGVSRNGDHYPHTAHHNHFNDIDDGSNGRVFQNPPHSGACAPETHPASSPAHGQAHHAHHHSTHHDHAASHHSAMHTPPPAPSFDPGTIGGHTGGGHHGHG